MIVKLICFILIWFLFFLSPIHSFFSKKQHKSLAYLSITENLFKKIIHNSNKKPSDFTKINNYINKALILSPNIFDLNYRFAVYLAYQNKFNKALFFFKKALHITYNYPLLHFDLCKFYFTEKNPYFSIDKTIFHAKASLNYLEKDLLSLNTEVKTELYVILAQAYFHINKRKRSFSYILEAIKIVKDKNYKSILEEKAKFYANIK